MIAAGPGKGTAAGEKSAQYRATSHRKPAVIDRASIPDHEWFRRRQERSDYDKWKADRVKTQGLWTEAMHTGEVVAGRGATPHPAGEDAIQYSVLAFGLPGDNGGEFGHRSGR